jgi:predicted small metal-binding protein
MTRKYLDCRDTPSVAGCTLAMSGEEDELLRAAAMHAADVHGHTDNDELRQMVRSGMRDVPVAGTEPGGFIQLIEFRTDHLDEMRAMEREWADASRGSHTARWGIITEDHDNPHNYVQLVEFPNYQEAMTNSTNPETTKFADRMRELCDGEPHFVNLDVQGVSAY